MRKEYPSLFSRNIKSENNVLSSLRYLLLKQTDYLEVSQYISLLRKVCCSINSKAEAVIKKYSKKQQGYKV